GWGGRGGVGPPAAPGGAQAPAGQAPALGAQEERPAFRGERPAVPGLGGGPDRDRRDRRWHGAGDPGGNRRGRAAVPDREAVRIVAGAVPQHVSEQLTGEEALAATGAEPAAAGVAAVCPVGRPNPNAAGGVLPADQGAHRRGGGARRPPPATGPPGGPGGQ